MVLGTVNSFAKLAFNNNNNHDTNNNNYVSKTTANCCADNNNIMEFYRGSNVFLTGCTGFLGKAILEKLLRTCHQLNKIYVLIRAKNGMPIESRLEELCRNPVFGRLHDTQPHFIRKIHPICGDISLPNLGLSEKDRDLIISNATIVIHSAATIKFNESLRNAVILNVLGTKRVLELCHKIQNLKSFVHVSTAFSNCNRQSIDEIVYKPEYDADWIIRCVVDNPTAEETKVLAKKLLRNHPNTYTLTKGIAEYLVWEYSSYIPSAIVRPSIITAAWKEPYPGWVDNFSGVTGIIMECSRGTVKTILGDKNCIMDIIPVDIVVNTIVCTVWHTATQSSNAMRIYNCTSGNMNGIKWKYFGELTLRYSLEFPSKYVTWYPGFTYRTNKFVHLVYIWFYHLIPSAFLDVFLYCTRQKPIMLKISKKFWDALQNGSFFSLRQWDFKSNTMEELIETVQNTRGSTEFNVSLKTENGFQWDAYIKNYILGIRQYVLKDDLRSLTMARTKLNRLLWFQRIFQCILIYGLLRLFLQ